MIVLDFMFPKNTSVNLAKLIENIDKVSRGAAEEQYPLFVENDDLNGEQRPQR